MESETHTTSQDVQAILDLQVPSDQRKKKAYNTHTTGAAINRFGINDDRRTA